MVKHAGTRPRLKFTGGGRGLAVHAGARLLADLADSTGLTAALSEATAATKQRDRGHGRGRVLVDAAVMIADGGEAICDIAALAGRPRLFGEVASPATATACEPTKPATNTQQLQSNHPKVRNSADQLWGLSLIGVT